MSQMSYLTLCMCVGEVDWGVNTTTKPFVLCNQDIPCVADIIVHWVSPKQKGRFIEKEIRLMNTTVRRLVHD